MAFYVDEITQVLQDRFSGDGKPLLFLLHGKNTDSGNYSKPASFEVNDLTLAALCQEQVMLVNFEPVMF
jgi:hypothetical protein